MECPTAKGAAAYSGGPFFKHKVREEQSLKVVVYAICKNESQFVDRWMDSMGEADQVVVLDTGSTDDTAEKLRGRGAEVTEEQICPWRFDTARNRSLELVPEDTDICVCTDLDEVFHPGWASPSGGGLGARSGSGHLSLHLVL